jgi:LysM repeat protein
MKFIAPFICSFLTALVAAAQPLPIVEKEGQKFYRYALQEGQTLTQLESLFKLDADNLLAANPGLERGIEAGQVINVPVQRGLITHKVLANQTLYAIARIHEVHVDSLLLWNPSAKSGLKVGQSIIVKGAVLPFEPNKSEFVRDSPPLQSKFPHKLSDTLIKHTVLEKETLYAISKRYMVPIDTLITRNKLSSSRVSPGQQVLVPIRESNTAEVSVQTVPASIKVQAKETPLFPVPFKSHYDIAVFLPFQLDSNAANNRFVAAAALDFYMGMKIALDSLKLLGFSADIHVFDDNSVTTSLEQVLQSQEMQGIDLIFSPLQEKQARIVAAFAKENDIPMIFPVQMPLSLLELSPKFMAYTTPDAALVENLATHLHRNYQGSTIVLISSPNAADQLLEQRFKSAFLSVPTSQSKLKLQEANWSNYQKFKTVGGPQLLVSFSSDRAKVMGLLKVAATDTNIRIVGHKDWIDYKELDDPEVRNQAFLVALPSYFNYHDRQIIPFHKAYRKRYNADLSKMACLGYDITLHVGKQLLGDKHPKQGLISNMTLNHSSNRMFIENNASVLVNYKNAQLLIPNNE